MYSDSFDFAIKQSIFKLECMKVELEDLRREGGSKKDKGRKVGDSLY